MSEHSEHTYCSTCPECMAENAVRPKDPNFYPSVRNAPKNDETLAEYRKRMGLYQHDQPMSRHPPEKWS